MHSDVPFAVWSRERQRRIEDVLARALSDDAMPAPARLGEAMRYAVLGGGKRVRPLLAYAAGEAAAAVSVHWSWDSITDAYLLDYRRVGASS